MRLDTNFRNNLFSKLIENKKHLESNSIEFINKEFETYNRVCLDNISRCAKNKQKAINSVTDSLKVKSHPVFQLRKTKSKNLWDNEIKFSVIEEQELMINSEEEIKYRKERRVLEQLCEDEFWKQTDKEEIFKNISNFECYEKLSISKDLLSKYNDAYKNYYNLNGWETYIIKLLKSIFTEYEYSEKYSSKKIFRFLKKISEDLYFGFEFDNSELKKEIKKGEISLPQYLNLIIVGNEFNKDISPNEYIFNYNDTILSLGILGNPFFFEPCFPLSGYYAIEMVGESNNPFSFTPKYHKEFLESPNGEIVIKQSEVLGEKLKRHAFYYLNVLKNSSESYLDYLESSIKSAI